MLPGRGGEPGPRQLRDPPERRDLDGIRLHRVEREQHARGQDQYAEPGDLFPPVSGLRRGGRERPALRWSGRNPRKLRRQCQQRTPGQQRRVGRHLRSDAVCSPCVHVFGRRPGRPAAHRPDRRRERHLRQRRNHLPELRHRRLERRRPARHPRQRSGRTFPFFSQQGAEYGNSKFVYLSPQFAGFDLGLQYAPNTGNGAYSCSYAGAVSSTAGTCPALSSSRQHRRWRTADEPVCRGRPLSGHFRARWRCMPGAPTPAAAPSTTPVPLPARSVHNGTYNGKFDNQSVGFGGAALTIAGVTFGGAYQGGQYNGLGAAQPQNGVKGRAWIAGVQYAAGPLVAGVSFFNYQSQGAVALTEHLAASENGLDVGGTYNIAPGLWGFAQYLYGTRHQGDYNFVAGRARRCEQQHHRRSNSCLARRFAGKRSLHYKRPKAAGAFPRRFFVPASGPWRPFRGGLENACANSPPTQAHHDGPTDLPSLAPGHSMARRLLQRRSPTRRRPTTWGRKAPPAPARTRAFSAVKALCSATPSHALAITADTGGGGTMGVNAYLWRGALDTLSFMPLASADPFGGVIITDWYTPPNSTDERFKATAYILSRQLRSDGVRVTIFRQVLRERAVGGRNRQPGDRGGNRGQGARPGAAASRGIQGHELNRGGLAER